MLSGALSCLVGNGRRQKSYLKQYVKFHLLSYEPGGRTFESCQARQTRNRVTREGGPFLCLKCLVETTCPVRQIARAIWTEERSDEAPKGPQHPTGCCGSIVPPERRGQAESRDSSTNFRVPKQSCQARQSNQGYPRGSDPFSVATAMRLSSYYPRRRLPPSTPLFPVNIPPMICTTLAAHLAQNRHRTSVGVTAGRAVPVLAGEIEVGHLVQEGV